MDNIMNSNHKGMENIINRKTGWISVIETKTAKERGRLAFAMAMREQEANNKYNADALTACVHDATVLYP